MHVGYWSEKSENKKKYLKSVGNRRHNNYTICGKHCGQTFSVTYIHCTIVWVHNIHHHICNSVELYI